MELRQEDTDLPPVTLVLGGARSGKSRFAEGLFAPSGPCTYIATAEARDAEMRTRIERHQDRRGPLWHTCEAPLDLVGALTWAESGGTPVLIDCLTLWLSNLIEAERDIAGETEALCACLASLQCKAVVVSNEVGQGIVPANALARHFRDESGKLNQAVAAVSGNVFFVTAGIAARLK